MGVDSEGQAERRKKGEKIHYVPFLKTHCWKLGQSFVKQKPERSAYRRLYDTMRATVNAKGCKKVHKIGKKILSEPPDCIDAHRFAKACRMTSKIFLSHLYLTWRTLEGLVVHKPFAFGVLGHAAEGLIPPMMDEGEIPEGVSRIIDEWTK